MNLSWLKSLLLGLLLLPLAYLSFKKFSDYSWVVILLASFIYLLLLGLKTKSVTLKKLFFNISAIFFTLFLYEGFLWLRNISLTNGKSVKTSGDYAAAHPYLGYGSKNDGVFTSKGTINNDVIFDVSYTIKDGLRYTPNSNEKSQNCVLFFGCSFTFGEGLSDTSTLPFFFNQYSKQQYKVFNYGFTGYGPHQMLANIENRVAKDIQSYKNKKIAIYSFITDHVSRAAGYASWDQNGPNYEIIDGSLRKVGTFTKLPRIIVDHLARSHIYKRLFCERKPSHYDWMRTIEIIKKSNELLLKDSVILYVFVWDNPRSIVKSIQNDYYYFIDEMKKNNIKTFFLHDAIWDYDEKINTYSIHKDDLHPNGLANEKIAKYLYLQLKDYKQTIN
jgi:hypothetical protein